MAKLAYNSLQRSFLVLFSIFLLSGCGNKEVTKSNIPENKSPSTPVKEETKSEQQIGEEIEFIEGEEKDLEAVKEVALQRLETLAKGEYEKQYALLHSDSKKLISEKDYISNVAISRDISNLRIKKVDFIKEKYFPAYEKTYKYVVRAVGEFEVVRLGTEMGSIITNDGSWYFVKDTQADNQWRILYDRF